LQFFLINSTIRNDYADAVSIDNLPRINRKGFPFCLVSFQIGTILDGVMDEPDNVYLPNYAKDPWSVEGMCIYMFFDTHIGRGHQIL